MAKVLKKVKASSTLSTRKEWKVLTESEQAALSLSFGHNKSSWQAGEILGKSHYKYLELKARAAFFLKRFNEHFRVYEFIIPRGLTIHPLVEAYFNKTIGKRLKITEALREIDDNDFGITSFRNKLILEEVRKLEKSSKLEAADFVNLIKDFDRWNNFRILPPELQEPTAYKRRNKHKIRKILKKVYDVSPIVYDFLVKKYSVEKSVKIVKPVYVPLFLPGTKVPATITISRTTISDFTDMGLFVFAFKPPVEKFHNCVGDYMKTKKKHCRDGQKFWPVFRLLIKEAVNYEDINNLSSSRRLLEYASEDTDRVRSADPEN